MLENFKTLFAKYLTLKPKLSISWYKQTFLSNIKLELGAAVIVEFHLN